HAARTARPGLSRARRHHRRGDELSGCAHPAARQGGNFGAAARLAVPCARGRRHGRGARAPESPGHRAGVGADEASRLRARRDPRSGRQSDRAAAVDPQEAAAIEALAPFRIRSFRFQWPADLATSWAFEMEALILGWYILIETGSVESLVLFASLAWLGS